mgnify:CR=1 FL=1
MWGQRPRAGRASSHERFTPTRVGTTVADAGRDRGLEVHPHACGDNGQAARDENAVFGSPPRVWGQRDPAACAARPRTVHPHACGDNSGLVKGAAKGYGSPPRVWGQLNIATNQPGAVRFTPTRVGTTTSESCATASTTVHPHACGDNLGDYPVVWAALGSPPRVWGQLPPQFHQRRASRFTPTRVGTTRRDARTQGRPLVHPHACGDNMRRKTSEATCPGSPPRVWGQPDRGPCQEGHRRFTPTRVGTTWPACPSRSPGTVHPHACGDNEREPVLVHRVGGSPPRVWGQRRRRAASAWCSTVHPHACGDN